MKNRIAIAGLLFSAGLLLAMPAGAEKPNLAMLDQLESGAWEVRMRGDAAPPRSMWN